jgi:hypothetical protein
MKIQSLTVLRFCSGITVAFQPNTILKAFETEPGRSSVFLVRQEDTVDVVKIMRVHQLGGTGEARSKSQSNGILER